MTQLKLVGSHTYFTTLEMLRQPMYVVSTVIFPAMFFWFFGVPNATDKARALLMMGSFASFGVLGVLLFQFAVEIAQEKNTSWSAYLRVLPVATWVPLTSRILSGLFFAALSVIGVIFVAHLSTPLAWSDVPAFEFFTTLFLGAIPFGLIGMTVGLSCKPSSAVPVANLIYLPLSFAGGLWMPPEALPKVIQGISKYLPTRHYGECVWASLLGKNVETEYLYGLIAYAIVFLFTSIYLYKTREDQIFK